MAYTREEIIAMVHKALETPEKLYALRFVNYKGFTDGERYTEIAARELLEHVDVLFGIQVIKRQNYKTKSHERLAQIEQREESRHDEEWIAKKLLGKTMNTIGTIIDYQTPLKSKQSDKAGKIDLLAYNENEKTLYILELKKSDSRETLLRCILEIYTYSKTVDKKNLLRSFSLSDDTSIREAALIYENKKSQPYKDFMVEATSVRALARELGVDIFIIDEAGENITAYMCDTL